MKKRNFLPLLPVLLASLFLLAGCALPHREPPAASLELRAGGVLPEGVTLSWNPEALPVDSAEVAVTGDDQNRAITVTIRLRPD